MFSAQYQQEPVTTEGNMIRMEWFGTYDEVPERHRFLKVIQSWDTGMTAAPTSDYSVCTTWGFERDEKKWYLLDVLRERLDFPDLKRAIIRLRKQYRADRVLIEKAGSGYALFPELKATAGFNPIMIQPVLCKEERFNACLGEVEAGHLLLPQEAPWLDAFRSELRAFPQGKHDDQVDSFSQFVIHQLKNWNWILTEFDDRGRAKFVNRYDNRPW